MKIAIKEHSFFNYRDLVAAILLKEAGYEVLFTNKIPEVDTDVIYFGSFSGYLGMGINYTDSGRHDMLKDIWDEIVSSKVHLRYPEETGSYVFAVIKRIYALLMSGTSCTIPEEYDGTSTSWYKALEYVRNKFAIEIKKIEKNAREELEVRELTERVIFSQRIVRADKYYSPYVHRESLEDMRLLLVKRENRYRVYDLHAVYESLPQFPVKWYKRMPDGMMTCTKYFFETLTKETAERLMSEVIV